MPSAENDESTIAKLLKGRTMSVYALLLTHKQLGVRYIQRALGFSSPSLALHHLNKLMDLGLVTKNSHGEYSVSRVLRIGSLSLFVKIGKHLLPRLIFLISLLMTGVVLYLILFGAWPLEARDIMFLGLSMIIIFLLVKESMNLWELKPF